MAPNGDEKAFAVTGQSYRRLLEQTQLGDNGEHGPFCKSRTRGKGQLTCDDTEDRSKAREAGRGQAGKGGGKEGSTGPASISKHSKERAEDGACTDVPKDEGGGGTRAPE